VGCCASNWPAKPVAQMKASSFVVRFIIVKI
jgi:hypothetical protein